MINKTDRKVAYFLVGGRPESMVMSGFSEGYTISEFIDFIRHCYPNAYKIDIRDY